MKRPEGIAFTEDDGQTWTPLSGDTPVSMNFWGLSAGMMDALEEGITEFFEKDVTANLMKSEYLLPAMAEATGARAMGIYQRDTYSGMNWSTVPSILVEMGFMSNPEEDKLLNDPDYQLLLVQGMVQGIEDYVNSNSVSEEYIGE